MLAGKLVGAGPVAVLAHALVLVTPGVSQERDVKLEAADAGTVTVAAEPPLEPGDVVQLSSWQDSVLSGDYIVWDDGSVSLPLLGRTQVAEVPADELTRALEREYGEKFLEDNAVEVTLKRRVRVLGAVQRPGLYYVDRTMTAVDAVALAGGAAEEGEWNRVRIIRDGREFEARLDAPAGSAERLRSGDQIVLPRRSWFARNSAMLVGGSVSAVAFLVVQLLVF